MSFFNLHISNLLLYLLFSFPLFPFFFPFPQFILFLYYFIWLIFFILFYVFYICSSFRWFSYSSLMFIFPLFLDHLWKSTKLKNPDFLAKVLISIVWVIKINSEVFLVKRFFCLYSNKWTVPLRLFSLLFLNSNTRFKAKRTMATLL